MTKTILITGGSTGIGAATALELAKANTVFVHYHRSKHEAGETARRVEARGGDARLIQSDLMSESGCRNLIEAVRAQTDRLDVLVNNTGGLLKRHDTRDLSWDLMERIFRLNTFSAMMMTTLSVSLLKKGDSPCIINVTSIAMRTGAPTATVYGAAKSAIDAFTRGSARELAPAIRVNAVAPGVIDTPFHDQVTSDEHMKRFKSQIPLKCLGQPDQIARTIRFLIENPFITGETVDVNGGHFMR